MHTQQHLFVLFAGIFGLLIPAICVRCYNGVRSKSSEYITVLDDCQVCATIQRQIMTEYRCRSKCPSDATCCNTDLCNNAQEFRGCPLLNALVLTTFIGLLH